MDLDQDGRTDILSGSWPGAIFFFRRKSDGTFAAGEKLKDKLGKDLSVGSGTTPFAVDWNGDGRLDLLLGDLCGGFRGKAEKGTLNRFSDL